MVLCTVGLVKIEYARDKTKGILIYMCESKYIITLE